MSRRAWYLTINSLIGLWFIATVVVVSVHRLFPAGAWLMVHLLLLGAVSTAILVWSQHFADAMTRRAAAGGRVSHGIRLAAHTIGAILVVVGIVSGRWMLVLAGGVTVGVVALAHAVLLTRQLRGALPARFTPLVRYYVAAALFLVIGVTAGVLMARADLPAELAERLYSVHLASNLLGWVGLTVVGTVVLLWPTILRTQIQPRADAAARRSLWLLIVGVLAVVAMSLAGVTTLIPAGVAIYVIGLVPVIVEGVRQARAARPRTYAAYSIAAAMGWFVGCTIAFGVVLGLAPDAESARASLMTLVTPFAGGFAAQIVIGALSHLLPVVIGGGPEVLKRTAPELDRHAIFRVTVINAGGILYVLPIPSLARVIVSLVIFAVLVSFGWFVIRALRAVKREPKPAPASSALGAVTAAATTLVLALASGIALDPAAAGIGTARPGDAVATGETTTVEVVMRDTRFFPDRIEVPAGNRLVIELVNDDDMDHDLTVENGVKSPRLSAGERETIDVGIISGDLDAWCSIAGHRLLGMTLDIVAVGGTSATPAPGEPGSGAHEHPVGSTPAVVDHNAEPAANFVAYDATLPPAPDVTVHEHTFTVSEFVSDVAPGVEQTLWTFNDTVPGPTLRGKVGDVFDITLVNDGTVGHSIDFHAGALAPDEPMRTIGPGESLTYRFTATRAGIWMYHCSTAPMSLHIANGMFGAVIIDPPDLAPVDREYVLVQSEYYLGAWGEAGSMERLQTQHPDLVVFNGHARQYRFNPLEARVGERVRVWVLDAGPNRPSSFHIIGGQFDTVYFEGDYLLREGGSTGVGGSQALALQPAQGGFVELEFPEAGHYPFVTHIMSDAEKGASGIFRVTD